MLGKSVSPRNLRLELRVKSLGNRYLNSEDLKHINSEAGAQTSSDTVKASMWGGRIEEIYPETSLDKKWGSGERKRQPSTCRIEAWVHKGFPCVAFLYFLPLGSLRSY